MGKQSELVKWNGRNSKLTKEFVGALDQVLSNPNTILYNQEEIITEANEYLKPEQRIGYRTFLDWKEKGTELKGVDDETKLAFSQLSKKIKRVRKQAVAQGMLKEGAGSWQKFAWIGERIDPELNLARKVDVTTTEKVEKISISPPKELNVEEADYVEIKDSE